MAVALRLARSTLLAVAGAGELAHPQRRRPPHSAVGGAKPIISRKRAAASAVFSASPRGLVIVSVIEVAPARVGARNPMGWTIDGRRRS